MDSQPVVVECEQVESTLTGEYLEQKANELGLQMLSFEEKNNWVAVRFKK